MEKNSVNINYKLWLLIILCSVLIFILFIYIFYGVTLTPFAMYPPFADLIGITSAVDSLRVGANPYIINIFDPWGRLFNYPKIWLIIFNFFNFDYRSTNLLGIIFAFLFASLTSFLFEIKKKKEFLFILIILLSPPILLLLERGNSDILIYLLIILSVFYINKIPFFSNSIKIYLKYSIILFAIILKIYPIFLIPLIFFEKISNKKRIIIIFCFCIALATYFIFTYKDILLISQNTPMPSNVAYGKNIPLQHFFNGRFLFLLSNSLILFVFGVALYLNNKFKKQLDLFMPISIEFASNIFLFITGALLYLGTFFIGNNWDYRLVFLLFTVPYILNIFRYNKIKIIIIVISSLLLITLYGTSTSSLMSKFVYPCYTCWYSLKILATWGLLLIISIILFYLFKNRNRIVYNSNSL